MHIVASWLQLALTNVVVWRHLAFACGERHARVEKILDCWT